ncbi:MAG: dienelactone hydrolase family protein [Thermoleophilaceae bacterium]|nr:dienelactone hydrolase family protein [Thermoleophilaceae bacterium]
MEYADRTEAGQRLGARMKAFAEERPVVVGMPRGGVPVAIEVAKALGAPFDIAVVRKLGAPGQSEFAIGAIAEGGIMIVQPAAREMSGASDEQLARIVRKERAELERRANVYRAECPMRDLNGRTVILVDDGLATGSTAIAAARSLRARGAEKVILAVPVCPPESLEQPLDDSIERVVCPFTPSPFFGVGLWFRDFEQVGDDAVIGMLREAVDLGGEGPVEVPVSAEQVEIREGAGVRLLGDLTIPEHARGLIVFAHGSGSSRTSPRNQMVARTLNHSGFATLLFDLLDPVEADDPRNTFDIPLLGRRLVVATEQMLQRSDLAQLPVGLFGASTGAAAALWASAELEGRVSAVVSRGGRPDLAMERLEKVTAPTLLIVGGEDHTVIGLNRAAAHRMFCPTEILIVEGAGHLFEQPGQLERVAGEAAGWFGIHMRERVTHELG